MIIIPAATRQYAFTLRRTNLKRGVTEQEYINHVRNWEDKGLCTLIDHVFEKTAGLHMHGVLEISKKQDKRVFRVRGWNIYLEEIYNRQGWQYYMMKDQKCNEDLESFIEDEEPVLVLKKSLFKRETASDSV